MLTQGLSSCRELVEQLDPEPLYDYLTQNGVLHADCVKDLHQEKSPVKTNISLLKQVEDHGKSAVGLLLIALRQSGQHHLANLLDDTGRIKALSGSGYLSKSRHKGQLSLKLTLRAIKLSSECLTSSTGELLHSREWLSVDDFTPHSNGSTETSIPQFEVLEAQEESKSSCLCGCFTKLFKKSKGQKTEEKTKQKYVEPEISRSSSRHANSERYMNLENIFKGKASELYTSLTQRTSSAHTGLLKYMEQDRSLLVLDTSSDLDGMTIIVICTTPQQFHSLRQDYNSAKLASDIEKSIISETMLLSLGANGLKIHVNANSDELEQVDQELS